jgi:hypothetical protein
METLRILFVGDQSGGDDFEASTSQETGWQVTTVYSDEAAIEKSCLSAFDVAIIGADVNQDAERKLKAVFHNLGSAALVLRQNGRDTSDIDALKVEIKRLINERRLERIGRIHVTDTLNVENLAGDIRLV